MKSASLFVLTSALFCSVTTSWGAGPSSSLATFEEIMLAKNPQLRALESTVKTQKAATQAQNGKFLPQVSLAAGYASHKTEQEPSEGYLGYISGQWNLYRGNEDSSTTQIFEKEYQVAQLNLDIKTRALRRQLREVYYALLTQKKNLLLLDDKSEALKNQRQMAQKKINAGLTSNVDALEIDLEENTLVSERETIKADIENLTRELSALLNIDPSELSVSAHESFDTTTIEVSVEKALINNPLLKKQSELEDISHLKVLQQRSEFLPQVDLEARYGRITPAYADPSKGAESEVALLFKWNLFSGMSSVYKTQSATSAKEAQEHEKRSTHLEIKKEIENSLTNRINIVRLLAHQQKRLKFTQQYYEMTLAEYKRGVKNSPDLQTATASLFEAKQKMNELERDLSIVNAKIHELI